MTETTKKKHVTRELNDYYYLPDEDQWIVQVIRGCGNNLHEVITPNGQQYLVSMPTKFRRSVWIKRGDYLIVSPIEEGNKVRAEIHSILLKDHIRYLKEQNKWPKEFLDQNELNSKHCHNVKDTYDNEDNVDDDLLVPNTNRPAFYEESNEEDEEDDR